MSIEKRHVTLWSTSIAIANPPIFDGILQENPWGGSMVYVSFRVGRCFTQWRVASPSPLASGFPRTSEDSWDADLVQASVSWSA